MEQELIQTDLERLKYPIGKFRYPNELNFEEAQERIDEIERLPGLLRGAVEDLDDSQLDTPYRPGGWTVRQVIHHIPDSHMNGYVRFHLGLTEDEPAIKPYNEAVWAELTDARTAPIEISLYLIEALHARWTALMRSMKHEELTRTYLHPEAGKLTLYKALANYAWHGNHHLAHITSLRERNNW